MGSKNLAVILVSLLAIGCVDMPPEPDTPYIQCSKASGFWGAVLLDGKEVCSNTTVEVTQLNTLHVTAPVLDENNEGLLLGTLIMNFALPPGGVPGDAVIDDFTMGVYRPLAEEYDLLSASVTVREDADGALGTFEATVDGPNGLIEFRDGVYYSGPIQRP